MNKKFLYRIIGAIASALVIVSVFIPFVKVTGFSQSIWQEFSSETVYLPILIIVFGIIGVIFFALNFKIEFAYATTGGILFYVIMRTIDVVNQNVFNTLSIGYYFMIIGAIVTGIMAFLCTKESSDSVDNMQMAESQPLSNDLFNQSMLVGNMPIQDMQIPEQNLNINGPEILFENEFPNQNMDFNNQFQPIDQPQFQSIPDINMPIEQPIPDINAQNVMPNIMEQPVYNEMPISGINEPQQIEVEQTIPNLNINVSEPTNNIPVMPFNNEMAVPMNNQIQFDNTPIEPEINVIAQNQNMQFNPVIQEFMNQNNVNQPQSMLQGNMQYSQPQQSNFSVPSSNNFENSSTDIFGQPLNRG